MDPAPCVNPNKLILGETKLIFWPTGRTAKKNLVGWSIGKIDIILFDSQGSYFLKKNYFAQQIQKKDPQFIVYYNSDKCFLVLVIYISLLCIISFFFCFEKAEHNRLKKARLPKLCNIIFWFLLKIGSFRSIDQQINLISSYKLRLLHGDFSIYRLTVE